MNTKKRVAGGKQPSAFLRTAGGHFGKKLVVGEKCPVCGSAHHPESAKFKETAISEDDFSWGGGIISHSEELMENIPRSPSRIPSDPARARNIHIYHR